MSHELPGLAGGVLRPAPACAAVISVTPLSVSASASIKTRVIAVFMVRPVCRGGFSGKYTIGLRGERALRQSDTVSRHPRHGVFGTSGIFDEQALRDAVQAADAAKHGGSCGSADCRRVLGREAGVGRAQ